MNCCKDTDRGSSVGSSIQIMRWAAAQPEEQWIRIDVRDTDKGPLIVELLNFDRGKGEAGMGDYEVRNWTGWHHHQTLSLLASWFLNVETRRAEKKDSGDYFQPSESGDRIHHSRHLRMRFTPRRSGSNDEATPKKPTRKAVPLA